MIVFDLQVVSEIAAGRALNTVLEGLALAGLSWGALRCVGVRSSTTRFAVWFSTLLVIACLPFLKIGSSGAFNGNASLPELSLSSAWAWYLFLAWAAISGVMLLRLGLSLWHVYRLRRTSRPLELSRYPAVTEIYESSPRSRKVSFLISDSLRVPTALGFLNCAVVLPSWVLNELSNDEIKAIVLHELAHLRRWDDWTNLVQKVLKAVFFFHPAVWWIDSRLALEREIACDDLVLEKSGNAHTYAASLVSVAEKVIAGRMRMGRVFAVAQNALGRVREVSFRISRILAPRPRSTRSWRPALAMIGSMAVVTVTAMPYAPELISFQGKQPVLISQDTASLESDSAVVIPARWTEPVHPSQLHSDRIIAKHTGEKREAKKSVHTRVSEELASEQLRPMNRPSVIPAKTREPKRDSAAKMVLTKAPDRTQPKRMQLLFHSTGIDDSGAVWMFSVWRCIGPNGEQQTVQEIVMSSI
ncbi:MAG TPA: M56 family metallopeptidase [Terriglobales bacterium]|jgi:beta-lactamase regulating signal transducer with metallopeptidase domain